MERESFENVEIAQLMNEAFINIKVDREELPDVDGLYMEFAQSMMSGAAGWPLNVILTPNLEPFFATTYLPPQSNHGLMGLSDLIHRINELWNGEERQKIVQQAEKIVQMFSTHVHTYGEEIPNSEEVSNTADLLYKMADPVYGGIKGAPKFPIGYQYSFMMRYYAKTKDNRAIFLVERTLEMMHRGGIYDHLGGGFSRYSVDEEWLVPHFEKMLYDNAILAQAYLEAWQLTKKPLYRQVCEEILDYTLRDMTHPQGGFYSAEDADSEGHEGLFYTWPYQEVINILGPDSQLFCEFYGIIPEGNFEGRNILHTPLSLDEFATQHKISSQELESQFAKQREQLWRIREKRIHPLKDDKILSAWNGLMIYSLAEAGKAFDNPRYIEAATKAAEFIKKHLWNNRQLFRRWREGQGMFTANLDEYAYMIRGILSLFEANQGNEWLSWAIEMTDLLKKYFKEEGGAFYQTDGLDQYLILRRCQFSDGAEPSGNAIHTENLLKLNQITQEDDYLSQAEDVLKAVKDYLENYPPGYCYHVMNLQYYYDQKSPTIGIAFNQNRENEEILKKLLYEKFIPHKVIIWQNPGEKVPDVDLMEEQPRQNQTTLYICYQGVCQKPLNELPAMLEAIEKL